MSHKVKPVLWRIQRQRAALASVAAASVDAAKSVASPSVDGSASVKPSKAKKS